MEIVPAIKKSVCAKLFLVLESSPNLVKPQLYSKTKLMSQKSGRPPKARLGLEIQP